jgi:hypothetical protein
MLALHNQVSVLLHMTTSSRRNSTATPPKGDEVVNNNEQREHSGSGSSGGSRRSNSRSKPIPGIAVGTRGSRLDSICSESSTVAGELAASSGMPHLPLTVRQKLNPDEAALKSELERQGWCSVS